MLRNLFQRACKSTFPTLNKAISVDPLAASHTNLYCRTLHHVNFQNFVNRKTPPKGFEKFNRRPLNKRPTKRPEIVEEENEEGEQEIRIEKEETQGNKKEKHEAEAEKKKDKSEKAKREERRQRREEKEEEIEDDEPKTKKKPKDEQAFGFGFNKDSGEPGKPGKIKLSHILIGGTLFAFAFSMASEILDANDISHVDFIKNLLPSGDVQRIIVKRDSSKGNYITIAEIQTTSSGVKKLKIGNLDQFLEDLENTQLRNGVAPDALIPVSFQYNVEGGKGVERLINLLLLAGVIYIFFFLAKDFKNAMGSMNKGSGGMGGDIFGVGKSQVKIYGLENKIKQRFKDVAGLDEAKVEITEFVEFLKTPKKFKEMGAKIPRGALLAGPPGTGKTLLAKAAAGEAGVPFLSISGSDFVEMFVGVGASRVRDLFKKAKEHAPAIIFIDEIDAVGRKRESKMGGNDERDNTLNQLLVEMDGFGTESNVVVLAATNRKELLDPALTRPGRFDRSIEITLPDIEGRKQIFMVHLKPLKLDPSRTMEDYAKRLSTLTPGFSGADIANLCNEAAILAARHNKKYVSSEEFESATERVIGGLEKKGLVSQEEKKIVAVHESGHAVVSWFLEGGAPLLKLTIIPRSKGSLGFAQYLPNESTLETKEELLDRICCVLGGRCAEELFNERITTGASDDLRKAYDIAEAIVTKFGMSEKVGFVGFPDRDYGKAYSDHTGADIDAEIKRIVDDCRDKTRGMVRQYRAEIERLSTALLEKESLDLQQIINILGQRPFPPKSNFKAYLEYKINQEQEIEAVREKVRIEEEEEEEEKEVEEEEIKVHQTEGEKEENTSNKEEKKSERRPADVE